jgi:hypothetical protein
MTVPAHASGFAFEWEPFVVDEDFALGKQSKDVFINKAPFSGSNVPAFENFTDRADSTENTKSTSTQKARKKFLLDNIKIDISSVNGVRDEKHKFYTDSDDERVSELIDAMTSLIYDDSKVKSLEDIGRIIEPQINFYFEF